MWTSTVPVLQYSKFEKLMYVTRAFATCTPNLILKTAGYDRSYSESNGREGGGDCTTRTVPRLLPVNLPGLTRPAVAVDAARPAYSVFGPPRRPTELPAPDDHTIITC